MFLCETRLKLYCWFLWLHIIIFHFWLHWLHLTAFVNFLVTLSSLTFLVSTHWFMILCRLTVLVIFLWHYFWHLYLHCWSIWLHIHCWLDWLHITFISLTVLVSVFLLLVVRLFLCTNGNKFLVWHRMFIDGTYNRSFFIAWFQLGLPT